MSAPKLNKKMSYEMAKKDIEYFNALFNSSPGRPTIRASKSKRNVRRKLFSDGPVEVVLGAGITYVYHDRESRRLPSKK